MIEEFKGCMTGNCYYPECHCDALTAERDSLKAENELFRTTIQTIAFSEARYCPMEPAVEAELLGSMIKHFKKIAKEALSEPKDGGEK